MVYCTALSKKILNHGKSTFHSFIICNFVWSWNQQKIKSLSVFLLWQGMQNLENNQSSKFKFKAKNWQKIKTTDWPEGNLFVSTISAWTNCSTIKIDWVSMCLMMPRLAFSSSKDLSKNILHDSFEKPFDVTVEKSQPALWRQWDTQKHQMWKTFRTVWPDVYCRPQK